MPTDKPRNISTASSPDGTTTGQKESITVVESNTSCPANVSATCVNDNNASEQFNKRSK